MFAKIAAGVTFSTTAFLTRAHSDYNQFEFGTGALPPDFLN